MPTVAAAVLDVFGRAGVGTAFGLPGVHNLAFWRDWTPGHPELMLVRHEQTTVYAADGYARATGGLGVALTTTGPGAANAVAAFGEAAVSGSPVVLLASEIPTRLARPGLMRGVLHESPDQAALFEPLAKAVHRPRTAPDAVAAVAMAVEQAMAWPRGPVYVDIPTDVLDQLADPPPLRTAERLAPQPDSLAAAVAVIDAADRIVIWAGGGVVQAGAESQLAALAQRLAAPVVTTYAARGVLPADHPSYVGLPPHEPEIADLVGSADLLLAVGTRFDAMGTRNWTMPRPPRLIAVNCDPADLARNYEPDVGVLGDAQLVLAALEAAVGERAPADGSLRQRTEATWQRLHLDAAGGPALRFVDAVDEARAAVDATVVVDMAVPGYWTGGYGRFEQARRLQYPVGWGTLGFALPASVGAGAARERPVLCICGDGGFMYGVGELAVLVQERLPVTVLVVDDGGYGMLRYDQDHAGTPHRGVDLVRPDFVGLAAAFGIRAVRLPGESAEVAATLAATLTAALTAREPRMVVVDLSLTPPRTTSPRWFEDA